MVVMGAADVSCVRSTTPRTWNGFGSRQLLSTNRQARMTVQFNQNGTTPASLAVWMYIVPNETMRCPLLLGRDSWTPASQTAIPHSTTPDPPDDSPPELLHRLDHSQRESFFRLWNTVPPHIRRIDFALDAAGWDPTALDALSTILTTYADVSSSSKLDYGECSLRPFEIKVPPGAQPI